MSTTRRLSPGSFLVWVAALVIVAVVALLSVPATQGASQRIAHLETLVKCPSCQDLSVAQSTSSSSLAVRHEIEVMVERGDSDSQILTAIESAYGPSVLLSPSTRGWGVVLWLVPAALFGALVVALIVLRRRR